MVESWFAGWSDRLAKSVPLAWPQDPEWWAVLRKALVISGADETVANEALDRLAQAPPKFASDVVEAVKRHVADVYRSRNQAGRHDPSTREGASAASRDCGDCGGEGLTLRYSHALDAPTHAYPCYCLCPLGRWIERHHRNMTPEVHRRTTDLARAEHAHLRLGPVAWRSNFDNRHRYRRSEWDEAAGRPLTLGLGGLDPDAPAAPLGIGALSAKIRRAAGSARPDAKGRFTTPPPAPPAPELTPSQALLLARLTPERAARLAALPGLRAEILGGARADLPPGYVALASARIDGAHT